MERLALHDCNNITNKGLGQVTGLVGLKVLSLRGCTKITNTGLRWLQVRLANCSGVI